MKRLLVFSLAATVFAAGSVSELGFLDNAHPHLPGDVVGSDYFNWLPHNLNPEAKFVGPSAWPLYQLRMP